MSANHTVVRGKRVLLVDDEEPLRALVRMMLELDGHVLVRRNAADYPAAGGRP